MNEINRGDGGRKVVLRIRVKIPDIAAIGKRLFVAPKNAFLRLMNAQLRWRMLAAVGVLVLAEFYSMFNPFFQDNSYALGNGAGLLPESSEIMASKVRFDHSQQLYTFNPGDGQNNSSLLGQQNMSSASLFKDPKKGLTVTDPVNKIDFKMIPKFNLKEGRQDKDRVVYPLSDGSGWLVYTLRGVGVKEDIVLNYSHGDSASYSYTLDLGDSMTAKVESDGSLGVYGNTLLSSNISAGSDKDAELLKKARKNAPKDALLFVIPKPVVLDKHGPADGISSKYSLNGNELTVTTTGMQKGNYPLSIDPSIYVVTASQFMQGNNETNINFDVDNKLIKKGRTTGALFNEWLSTAGLPKKVWGAQTVPSGGFVYSVGGTSFDGKVFTSQGSGSFVVPDGVTSITVKLWGGGGGGGGGNTAVGGAGGGGGYVTAVFSVTPGETLTTYVGGGGGGGGRNTGGHGGGGGGYSSIYRSGTPLALAGGGGGGGGGRATSSHTGGTGGPGGCTSSGASCNGGTAGGTSSQPTGGAGATSSGGGATGGVGANVGTAGTSLTGGNGGDGRSSGNTNGSAANGGLASGGAGGSAIATTRSGGGGGGAGYYGGGGGVGSTVTAGASGGGGGSNYIDGGATSVTHNIGSGTSPGNSGDTTRGGGADGGAGGAAGANGTAGDNGVVSITYGSGTSSTSSAVSWAKFNTGTGTIDSANPGTGACSGWCTTSAYNLPDGRVNYSLVAYNGFLYAMGGTSGNCTIGNATGDSGYCDTVYIAKLGANGEPRLWHPTDTNVDNWVYWYRDTDLPTERAYAGAVAYNNRMYLMGGRTSSTSTTTVSIADITPNGKLGTWASSGNSLPSSNQYDPSVQVYNDRLYVIGGASSPTAAPTNNVYYSKINGDGTINTWQQTSSLNIGRKSGGTNISVVWGAYIYVSGGCTTVDASGYCTGIASDTQIASINADGSLDTWKTATGLSDARFSHSLIAWRDHIYTIGGCTAAQNESTGDCNAGLDDTIKYGVVNQDGDLSSRGISSTSGTGSCIGGTPVDCDLPGTNYVGNMLAASIISNGFLYVMGGCQNNDCTTTVNDIAYAAISDSGHLAAPGTCPGGTYQSTIWCHNENALPLRAAAASPIIFGDKMYVIGGLQGAANTNLIQMATIGVDGSLSSWSSQSLSGTGAANVSYTYAYARANPASAGSNPGNLYIFGGCTTSSGVACSAYTGAVYKCNIQTSGTIASCSTTSQLQIGTLPGGGSAGIAAMSGTVYANYVYLIGGSSPDTGDITKTYYAKIDNSNNVVAASGSAWVESASVMNVGRQRAAAFGYNGYLYVVGGYDNDTGNPPDIEFVKINVSDGSLVGDPSNSDKWFVSAVEVNQRWGVTVPVSNSYAYIIGGCTAGASPSSCSTRSDTIQTVQIHNNGSGASAGFSTSANTYSTAPDRLGVSGTVLNDYIYIAGGCTGADSTCTSTTNNVSYAPIDANGVIGSWSSTSANLPANRAWGKLKAAGGSLYYIGGHSDTTSDYRTEVYYGTPSSGNISSWGTASNGLPSGRADFGASVWNNRLYVAGGLGSGTGCSGGVCNTVYVSPQLTSGGNIGSAWSTSSTSFNVARSGLVAVTYANNLYIFGGYTGSNYLSDSQYSHIDSSTGNAGSWSYSESLTRPLAQGDGFAANGYIYVVGGRSSANNCDPILMVAPVSANTSIASGNNPTGTGTWFETYAKYGGNRYGSAAMYHNGKTYVVGGGGSCAVTDTTLTTQGSGSYVVPPGITSISVKMWGAGGGAGSGATGATGGAGGGAGYTAATLSVTPGESLTTYVGGGGAGGQKGTNASSGGGGGGYSSIYRSTTPLMIAAGGGAGGGAISTTSFPSGGAGGAGGNSTSGVAGTTVTADASGGGGGTSSSGGAGGSGMCGGASANGASLLGGEGGNRGLFGSCYYGIGGAGGLATGGAGGPNWASSPYKSGGGGGGAGYYGGGGGAGGGTSGGASTGGSGGGGGGSSYVDNGATSITTTAGSGTSPGNSADPDRGTSGDGGTCSANNCTGTVGNNGRIVIEPQSGGLYASPVIQQATLLSQPQVAKYSVMFDTDSDVFPTHWLLNGVDNSIGANWQLKYRSMTNPGASIQCASGSMSTWGTETNFGNVTLGLPGVYTARDGSNANTNCARYFYFNVSVDSQNAFGYPDDVSRGPTITDLTLNMTADPAKRLMHGRTFIGGLQMPNDTPYNTN